MGLFLNKNILERTVFLLLFIILNLITPPHTFAASLQWHKSQGGDSFVQEIRISPSSPSIIYATSRTGSGSALLKSTDSGEHFNIILPFASGRDVNSIAISSSSANLLWIGTYEQGVFKSTDGGVSWSPSSGILPKKTRFITVDPINNNILYAGTGDNNSNGGIYKSIDGGNTWNQVGATTYGYQNCLVIEIDKYNHNLLYAGSDNGLYKSTDSGNTWSSILGYNTNFAGMSVDVATESTIYTSVMNQGIYKSIDSGQSWNLKNDAMGNSIIFRLAQDKNGTLFAARVNGNSGNVWRSSDKAEHWENVSDQIWGNTNARGLDANNGRIYVNIESLGIYYADTNPVPTPIVFIPGFGGSWSYKGLIENQPTVNSDWQLMPFFTDGIYQPLFSTLHNAGVDPLIFAYDFRKSVADSATSLNTFLTGKKVNVIAHSMGGLIVRQCYENVAGCSDKINKIVTAGSPNQGTLKAYNLWEAGQFDGDDLFVRTAEEIALHTSGFPYLTDKDIIQNKFPGVHDLLPNNFSNYSANFLNNTTAFSGNQTNTMASFTSVTRTKAENILGLWQNGKPGSYTYGPGDNTVLQTSSQLPNALTKYYNLQHNEYFTNNTSLSDLKNVFNLTTGSIDTTITKPSSILSFIIHSPATISVNGNTGIDGKAVFIYNPTSQNYNVVLTGTGNGTYQLDAILTTSTTSSKKTFTGTVTSGATINIKYNDFLYDDPNAILTSFRQKSATMRMRNLSSIEASVVQAVKTKSILALEKSYVNCLSLLVNETKALNRQNLKEACGQIFNLSVRMNQLYGFVPTTAVVNNEIARAQKAINLKLAKTSLLTREALNIQLAQQQLLAEGNPYSQRLLATGAIILAN